jgi:hypothetical protein
MARRLIESLSGVGDIYAGDVLLRAGTSYSLSVWSDDQPTGGSAVVIEGNIGVSGLGETVALAGPDSLTLELQDGRRLSFALASTGGRIVGRGGLQPA